MRKLFFLLVLVSGMLAAQTPNATNTQTIGKFLKLSKVPSGLETDNVLVRGTDGIVKFVPRSSISGSSQVNVDWESSSGVSQIINKPQFRTINGQSIFGTTDLTISGGTSIAHLEFDNTTKTIWNNGNGNIGTNTSFGEGALKSNTTGNENTANGNISLFSNTQGKWNTANGSYSLYLNTTGNFNTAVGYYSLLTNSTGEKNTAVGAGALAGNTIGANNVGIGLEAGQFSSVGVNNSGTNSIFIGTSSKALNNGETNQIVIGSTATGGGSNTVTIGNTSIVRTVISGVIQKRALDTDPISATATGTVGEIRFTATHVYWCIAPNTWIRAAGSTW